jgi:tetratricopeptide (TPR) repeat protein
VSDGPVNNKKCLVDCDGKAQFLQLLPLVLFRRGSALQKLKRFDEALKDYAAAIAHHPPICLISTVYDNYGRLLQKTGQHEKAIQIFTESIRVNHSSEAHMNRAISFRQLNAFDRSLSDLETAMRILETNPSSLEVAQSEKCLLIQLCRMSSPV